MTANLGKIFPVTGFKPTFNSGNAGRSFDNNNKKAGIENNTLTYVYSTLSDKKIVSKENKNIKLSKKEVEEFKDTIKDRGGLI